MNKIKKLNKKAIVRKLAKVINDQNEVRNELEELIVELILGLDDEPTKPNEVSKNE